MEKSILKELEKKACKVRLHIIEGTFNAGCGHPGGSLSAADLITYLYFNEMRVFPSNEKSENRDRFVLSKGHAAPALYGALALKGFISEEEIKSLRKVGSTLQGHPNIHTPGVDMSTGSLGHGVSAAVGMALAGKIDKKDYRVYTLLGDGEIEEGEVWEAAMFASAKKLDNLVVIVDNNNLQIDGTVEEVNSPYPIDEKFKAFGFEVLNIDGHDFEQMESAFATARTVKGKPTAIIMKTTKGKGVSFMEDVCGWHGKAPDAEQYITAIGELRLRLAELEA